MYRNGEEFHTFRGYTRAQSERDRLSASMEDYLEMIFRLAREEGFTRVNDVAGALNVQPPSVTRMIQRLAARDLLEYERYGVIVLTGRGRNAGCRLLQRHNMLEELFTRLGLQSRLLENVERIEHNLTPEAVDCLFALVDFLRRNPKIQESLSRHQSRWTHSEGCSCAADSDGERRDCER